MNRIKCILLRHGRTEDNKKGAYIGRRSDPPLSEEGIRGTKELTAILRKLTGTGEQGENSGRPVIVTSPLKRAVQTAEIIKDMTGAESITLIPELSEIDFGELEGKTHAELDGDPAYQAWIDSGGKTVIPGGENREEFIKRSVEGFAAALDIVPEGSVMIVVCHGGNIMSVMSSLTGSDYYEHMVPNSDGYILEIEKKDESISLLTFDRLCSGLHT